MEEPPKKPTEYERNLFKISEEMAKQNYDKIFSPDKWDDIPEDQKNYRISAFEPYARIALKHMAEQASGFFSMGFTSGLFSTIVNVPAMLQNQGLTP